MLRKYLTLMFVGASALSFNSRSGRAEEPGVLSAHDKKELQSHFKGSNDPHAAEKFLSNYSDILEIRRQIAIHPETVDSIFQGLTAAIVQSVGAPKQLAHLHDLFLEAVSDIDPENTAFSKDQANKTADELIDVYENQQDKLPNQGAFIVDFVARFGETKKSKAMILKILRSESPSSKAMQGPATISLYWGRSFRRDADVVKAMTVLFEKGSQDMHDPQAYNLLSALSRIDIDHAAPILKKKIESARDVYTFNKVASIVSGTHRNDLLEAVFKKYYSFKSSNPGLSGNPSIGIYKEAVVEYLEKAEGPQLDWALDVLFSIGGHPPLSRTILLRKLSSPDTTTKKAVLNYLRREIERGAFIDENMAAALNHLAKNDSDSEIAREAGKMEKIVRTRLPASK